MEPEEAAKIIAAAFKSPGGERLHSAIEAIIADKVADESVILQKPNAKVEELQTANGKTVGMMTIMGIFTVLAGDGDTIQ